MNMLEYVKIELAKRGMTLDDVSRIDIGSVPMTKEQFINYAPSATYIPKSKRPHLVRVK